MTTSTLPARDAQHVRRVLVLGDTDIQRVRLSDLLAGLGLEVRSVGSPDDAYRTLRAERRQLDLVLVDLCQLEFDGLAVLHWLRSKGLLGDLPVWVMEDPFEPTSVEICQSCSISRCLSKSSTPEEMAAWINEAFFRVAQDKRRHPRVAVFAPAVLGLFERKVAGYLTDLSATGAFVQTTTPFPADTRVSLRFQLPGASEPIALRGRVVRVNVGSRRAPGIQTREGMGLEFEDLSSVARAMILGYLDRHAAGTLDLA
jgi:uncharacterized protein (TIGR02266 family)